MPLPLLLLPLASALVIRATVCGMSSLGVLRVLSWALREVLANMLKRDSGGLVAAVASGSEELAVATIISMPSIDGAGACLLSEKDQRTLIQFARQARATRHDVGGQALVTRHVLEGTGRPFPSASRSPSFPAVLPGRSTDTSTLFPTIFSTQPNAATTLPSQEPARESPPASEVLSAPAPPPPTLPPPATPPTTPIQQTTTNKFPTPPAWLRWHKRKASHTVLPRQQGPPRKTLVLDLDQTLVECLHLGHAAMSPPNFVYTDSEGLRANVWLRPHLMTFLEAVSRDFEVVLFTAAAQRHADAVLSHVDPDRTLVQHRLYGHHTVAAPQWAWVKDLSRLGRDLSQTLIIDDCSTAALFQPESWVSIAPFSHLNQGWRDDTALLDILRFLQECVLPAADVRQAVREHYSQVACRPCIVGLPPQGEEEPLPGAGGGADAAMPGPGSDPSSNPEPSSQCVASLTAAAAAAAAAGCNMSDSMHRVRTVRHCLSVAASHG